MFNLAFCTATTCDSNVHTEVAIPVKFIQIKQMRQCCYEQTERRKKYVAAVGWKIKKIRYLLCLQYFLSQQSLAAIQF